MSFWSDSKGTITSLFQFGIGGVGARTNAGVLEFRNAANSGFADASLKNLSLVGFQATSRVFGINRRQAIATGPVNSSGFPNAITTTSGLSCQIDASSTNPIGCNFAAGFDVAGVPIDYTGTYASNQSYSGLAANTTHYFYLERNASTGVLTPTRITIAPVYSRVAPASPATGLHWFKSSQDSLSTQPGMAMYEWTGSAWIARQRVFIAEVTTGASAVSSIANYAYNRRYQSAWISTTTNAALNFAHNLGMTPAEAEASLTFYGRQNSSDLLHAIAPPGFFVGSDGYGILNYGQGGSLNLPVVTGSAGIYLATTIWLTSADIMCSVNGGW